MFAKQARSINLGYISTPISLPCEMAIFSILKYAKFVHFLLQPTDYSSNISRPFNLGYINTTISLSCEMAILNILKYAKFVHFMEVLTPTDCSPIF